MNLTIVTWNVNSIRIRLHHIATILAETQADIICLQEIKVIDELFPFDVLYNLGFTHIITCGEKSYNGVAILSRRELFASERLSFGLKDACRHISAKLSCGTEIHNLYIPAGGDIPDPELNPKFADKLHWLDQFTNWMKQHRKSTDPMVILGDFNIAPFEHDVWSHKQLRNEVSHTEIEIEKLDKLQASLDWIDVSRKFVPKTEKLYSWWSYRNHDWKKSDRGRRLDHIWITPSLDIKLSNSYIMRHARDWSEPSDHVPVVAVFSN
jgi:exodeoxyribonuclease-3